MCKGPVVGRSLVSREGPTCTKGGGKRCGCAGWLIWQGPDLLLSFEIACEGVLPFPESRRDLHGSHEARELNLDTAISNLGQAVATWTTCLWIRGSPTQDPSLRCGEVSVLQNNAKLCGLFIF